MKPFSLGLGIAVFSLMASFSALAQNGQQVDNFRMLGVLYSQTPTGKLISQPLSIKTLLGYFNHSDIRPRQTRVFIDGSFLRLENKEGSIIYGNIAYLGSEATALSKQSNPTITYNAQFLNSDLTGKLLVQQKETNKGKRLQIKYKLIGDNGFSLILRGSLAFSISVQ